MKDHGREAKHETLTRLSERGLARRWNVSQRTLQRWRSDRRGPPWLRIGGVIRYALEDVLAYEAAAHSGERP